MCEEALAFCLYALGFLSVFIHTLMFRVKFQLMWRLVSYKRWSYKHYGTYRIVSFIEQVLKG